MTYGAVAYAAGPYGAGQGVAATASGFPIVALAIAFDSPPGAEEPVWTDVSADLQLAKTRRGRSRELQHYQPGEAEFVLANHDRKYDPVYASSPYAGKILPMKRVRLEATYGGVTYPIYDGFIDSWEQVYEHPQEAQAVVKATDAFKVLAAVELASSVYAQLVSAALPQAWFRLGEAVGATTVADSVAAIPGTAVGATFGQTSLVGDTGTAVTFSSTGGVSVTDSRAFLVGTLVAFSFEAVITNNTSSGTQVILQQDGTDSCQLRLRMLGTGILEFQITGAGSAFTGETESTGAVDDGSPHHVVATYSATNGLRVWVDGVNVSNIVTVGSGSPVITATSLTLGNDKSLVVNGWTGVLDEVAIYSREVSATEIADHAAAVLSPWRGDSPRTRVNRVLDEAGWPTAPREIDAGKSTLQSATLGGTSLEHLQKVEDSEFGALFITRDGKVRFVGREGLVNKASGATFGDGTGEVESAALDFDYSDTDIRNDVTVSRSGGAAQRVTDAASIAAYLRHSYTLDGLIHNSDATSRSAANLILSNYADPFQRVTELRMEPITPQPTLFLEALERELTDWVIVMRRPQNLGAAIDQEVVVEGVEHEISDLHWVTTLRLSPAAAEEAGGFWQIGIPGRSEIGVTTRVYF